MSLEKDIIKLINETIHVDVSEVTDESNLVTDLGLDSLDSVEITMAVEEKYGITISETEMENVKTVGDLVKLVENNSDFSDNDEDEDNPENDDD